MCCPRMALRNGCFESLDTSNLTVLKIARNRPEADLCIHNPCQKSPKRPDNRLDIISMPKRMNDGFLV